MLIRLVLFSTLALSSGCCESLCGVTYDSAIDNCDDWYPRSRDWERNARCKSQAQESLDVCEAQCDLADDPPQPTY